MKGMYRGGDYDTSVAAAHSLLPKLSELQTVVYLEFKAAGARGLTDFELEQILAEKRGTAGHATYRKRRTELLQKGYIEDSGERRKYVGGKTPLTVWRIVDDTEIRQKALGLVLPHFPDAKIVAIRNAPLQDAPQGQREAPGADTPTPKLPEFLRRAKRSTPS